MFNLLPGDIIYDIETFPNIFTFYGINVCTNQSWYFEISERQNDTTELVGFLNILRSDGSRMIGFNNLGFDYPVIHHILDCDRIKVPAAEIYKKAMSLINTGHFNSLGDRVGYYNPLVPQIDLMKIHHFDNAAKATSLKAVEIFMRSESVQDLPFEPGTILTHDQMEVLKTYNIHDVNQTRKFYELTLDQIKFREELSIKYDMNFLNFNDTKIGKEYFIMRLEAFQKGLCFKKMNKGKEPRQTMRPSINLGDVVLPYVSFQSTEFDDILNFFKNKTITETKGTFKEVETIHKGFKFSFGLGGVHGSADRKAFYSDKDTVIEDWDVSSFYPNISIKNNFYPQHLTNKFCEVYEDVYTQRKSYKKGSAENAMLKLALNGVYGDSNNKYSPFYDPNYTMSITVNGQLLLCMFAEALMTHPDLVMMQINTDGLTIKYPKQAREWVRSVATWWENTTRLSLENKLYKRMYIRDVNNYLAVSVDGEIKRKGAYEYVTEAHKDPSMLVVAKAAEAFLVHGTDIEEFITNHNDPFDFMLRLKVSKPAYTEWGGERLQRTSRYYVSTDGASICAHRPPTGDVGTYKRKNKLSDSYYDQILEEVGGEWDERVHTKSKTTYTWGKTEFHNGRTVTICNDMSGMTFSNIDYHFYIDETRKLVDFYGC